MQTHTDVWSHGQLVERIHRTAAALGAAGLQGGERVLIAYPNGIDALVATFAVLRLGALAVPVMAQAGGERIAWLMEEIRPRFSLVPDASQCEPQFLSRDVYELVSFAGDSTREESPLPAFAQPQQHAIIRFTSGSTGRPKGVVLDHGQLAWSARTLARRYGLDEEHRELVIAPVAFSGAWQRVAATLWAGGCVVFGDELLSLPALLETVQELEVTGFFSPPPLIRVMLAARAKRVREALHSCRSIEIGSAPCTASELESLAALVPGARVFFHYGLTECSRASILEVQAHPEKLHTVGLPAPETQIEVRDDDGRRLGPGEAGQIWLTGPQRARAYWRDGAALESPEPWLASGDYGRIDEDGFLAYLGRRDDMIVSGGYSFYPAEIEAELGEVEGVAHYLIAGVVDADGTLGQVPWAFVVAREPERWSARAFLAMARQRLAAYKVPRRAVLVSALPLTASGKPDRTRAVRLYGPGGRDANGPTRETPE